MASEDMERPASGLVQGDEQWAKIEEVLIGGDLSRLTSQQRVEYYGRVCRSLGLNPLTHPFDYLKLNGREVLYAKRDATDQLRAIRGVNVSALEPAVVDDLYVVTATGRDRSGRQDTATGVVNFRGLTGEAKANAMMKAETKAKRRLTLSLCGLGFLDETEVGDLSVEVDPDTAQVAAPTSVKAALEAAKAREEAPTPVQAAMPVDDETAAEAIATAAPTPEPTGELCDSRSPYENPQPCHLLKGHQGNHRAETKESWR